MESFKLCIVSFALLALACGAPSDAPTDAPSAEVQSAEGTVPPTESAALVESVNPSGDTTQEAPAANLEETTVKEEKAAEMNASEEPATAEKASEPAAAPEKMQEAAPESNEKAPENAEKAAN
uniref:Uncharacterized protein n=2 Tax=Lygus hesperus TaxID=30085 RepID=A0A146LMR3_LYGHE